MSGYTTSDIIAVGLAASSEARARGRKVRVDHPRGGHDDHANALALAAAEGASRLVYGVHYRVF